MWASLCVCVFFLSACSYVTCCVCMCVYVCIYMYELKLVHRYICVHACIYACIFEIMPISSYIYIYIWACMYVCVYIYSKGNVLPSVLVPVYVLYIFRYHTLLYGRNKEIYLSYSRCFVLFWKDETDLDLSYCF